MMGFLVLFWLGMKVYKPLAWRWSTLRGTWKDIEQAIKNKWSQRDIREGLPGYAGWKCLHLAGYCSYVLIFACHDHASHSQADLGYACFTVWAPPSTYVCPINSFWLYVFVWLPSILTFGLKPKFSWKEYRGCFHNFWKKKKKKSCFCKLNFNPNMHFFVFRLEIVHVLLESQYIHVVS